MDTFCRVPAGETGFSTFGHFFVEVFDGGWAELEKETERAMHYQKVQFFAQRLLQIAIPQCIVPERHSVIHMAN